ncbi:MAG: hypothetical protein SVS15_02115 [Thermodesulfobacteriota bacterium]|nr:hypothetical protein [Thermodesulfobacteriota bacterium]
MTVGVSEDANTVQERIREIKKDFFQSETVGKWKRDILLNLEEVKEECSFENWDGYGASPIVENSYLEALRFIEILPAFLPIPEVDVDPDGEVAFEWDMGRRKVFSVSVGGHNELSYAGLFGSSKSHGTEYFGDELPWVILYNIHRVLM